MRWLLLGIVVVLAVAFGGLFFLPASLLPAILEEADARGLIAANSPRLELAETEGTLWMGRANRSRLLIDGDNIDLGLVTWQIDKSSLLKLQPFMRLTANSSAVNASAEVLLDQTGLVTLNKLEGRLPIKTLERWLPQLINGEVAFFIPYAQLSAQRIEELEGVLNFEYVDWLGGEYPMPLGSYIAELNKVRGGPLTAIFNDLQARLGMRGSMSVTDNGRYQFSATLMPRPELAREVKQSIQWLGRVDGNGHVLINTQGQF